MASKASWGLSLLTLKLVPQHITMAKKPNSIRDVLVKQLAKSLRKIHPGLRIEGHPSRVTESEFKSPTYVSGHRMSAQHTFGKKTVTPALLVVATDTHSITFKFHPWRTISQEPTDDLLVVYSVVVVNGNHLPKRESETFDLVHPDSIDALEKWMLEMIDTYIKAASPE